MVLRRSVYIIIFMFFSYHCLSQNSTSKIDSLKQLLEETDSSSKKAKLYGDLCWAYLDVDLKISRKYNDSSLTLHKKTGNEKGIANSNYRYGTLHRKLGEYDKAISKLGIAHDYAKKAKDTFTLANCTYQKGVVFGSKGEFEKSLENYYKSIQFFKSINDLKSVGMVLNSIGIIQKNLKDFTSAAETYKKAIATYKESSYQNGLSNTYGNLGNLYVLQNDYDKAIEFFKKSLNIDKQAKNNWGIAINNMDIGKLYLKQNKYNEAIAPLEKALKIQNQFNFNKEKIETLTSLGEAHRLLKNYTKSEAYLNEALEQNLESKTVKHYIYQQLSILKEDKKDYKSALENYKIASQLNDSVYKTQNIKSINELQIKYDTKTKEEEIANQKLKLIQKEKNFQFAVFGGGILLLAGLWVWLFYRQQQKLKNEKIETLTAQKELSKLESFVQGEEKERKRIAQDLHDGINGDLSVIKYKMTSINHEKFSGKEHQEFDLAIGMLDNAIEQVRHISQNLVPPSLQNFDLVEAVKQLCSKMESSSTSKIDFQHYGNYLKLKKEAETAIYRIIQELIYNTVKHANATRVLVQINSFKNEMNITVEDNGDGFDLAKNHQGIGLKNIESRVSFLDADLNVDSGSSGTTVTIHIDTKNLKK